MISCQGGGIGPLKRNLHSGIVEDWLEYSDEDYWEAQNWARLNAGDSGKTLHQLVFPSWVDECSQEFQSFHEKMNVQSAVMVTA
ncbi:hypothetical protein N7491_009431 [Penicillium cf. griseofulvum]|uniref:Uncharacterized protein n=1 Tax=Penicillium cf. griseofulvum TaxID=2972120 RepID=A0A9W9JNS8_9EURO|nr:hypothetical protein N7472_004976 [Penicillium cf. griseofulvum]KAJ5424215.1 hypothetical protein N7491_009431 [Penicillium cf. griseofulvum]KAJ5442545.1 hypothetical protein N7445_005552 [Penicillium cf. griseofulvum]